MRNVDEIVSLKYLDERVFQNFKLWKRRQYGMYQTKRNLNLIPMLKTMRCVNLPPEVQFWIKKNELCSR